MSPNNLWRSIAEELPPIGTVVVIQRTDDEANERRDLDFTQAAYRTTLETDWSILTPGFGAVVRQIRTTDRWRPMPMPEGYIHCGNCGS